MPAVQDEWQTVENRAKELGVEIIFDGILPKDEFVRHLLFLAIRECVTKQTVCAITNNGRVPQQEVVEGSGLSGLRRRIEREGGIMELTVSPRFVLTVILPAREIV